MKFFILIVLFSTPENPEPHFGDPYGFGARQMDSMEKCVKGRDMLRDQLDLMFEDKDIFHSSFCVEAETIGLYEGFTAFKKSLEEI